MLKVRVFSCRSCWEPPERELSDASSESANGLKQ